MNTSIQTTQAQTKKILVFLFIMLFMVFSYTFLHEGGHALIGVLAGGKVNSFSVSIMDLEAHVSLDGNFSLPQTLLVNVAGICLPALIWLVFILAMPKRANLAVEILKFSSTLMVMSNMVVWMVIPFLYLQGRPPSDDSVNFLNNSGIYPLWMSLAALLIFAGEGALYRQRTASLRGLLDQFRQSGMEWWTPGMKITLIELTGLWVMFGVTALGLNRWNFTAAPRISGIEPPAGYVLAKTIPLSEAEHNGEAVFSFSVKQPKTVGIFLLIRNINTEYFDLRLTGPDGYEKRILHGEGYSSGWDSSKIAVELQPGAYQVILTSRKSPGTASIYTKGLP